MMGACGWVQHAFCVSGRESGLMWMAGRNPQTGDVGGRMKAV